MASGCEVTPFTVADSNDLLDSCDGMVVRPVKGLRGTMDLLEALLVQEATFYPPCMDYLAANREGIKDRSDTVSESWRRRLCEWCYEVVDHFNFDREVVSIALNYLDRVVALKTEAANQPLQKREFQLLAVTCLYIAVKVHGETDTIDGPRRKLRIDAFVELSRGFFQVSTIEGCERDILHALNWHINPPSTLKFIASLLKLCPRWEEVDYRFPPSRVLGSLYDVARYLAELSVCVSKFTFTSSNSTIAFASILGALEALQATLPLPYNVRVILLNNISEATGLVPGNADVQKVLSMLRNLCPSMFEQDDLPAGLFAQRSLSLVDLQEHGDGKSSPVCVIMEEESPRSHRKRSRSAA